MKQAVLCLLLSILMITACGCMSETVLNEALAEDESMLVLVDYIPESTPEPLPKRLNVGVFGDEDDIYEYTRQLINNASTYLIDSDGRFYLNESAVDEISIQDVEGGRSYTFILNEALMWSDGEKVTANDYALGILCDDSLGDTLLGYERYRKNRENCFSGIRIHDENTLELIVSDMYSSDFFVQSYVNFAPVRSTDALMALDDGFGAYLSGVGEPADVSCGMYVIDETDGKTALLKRNENYPCEPLYYDEIYLSLISEDPETLIASGEMDICLNADLDSGKAEGILSIVYPSSKYKALFFRCDEGVFADVNIRQAVKHLAQIESDMHLSGDHSKAQWQYKESGALPQPCTLDIAKANELLDMSGYVYEADGRHDFDPEKASGEYIRYSSEQKPLEVSFLMLKDDEYAKELEEQIKNNAPLVGMSVNFEYADEDTLAQEYFYGKDHDGYFLEMQVNAADDKYYSWFGGYAGSIFNPMGLKDEELDGILLSMKECGGSEDAYLKLWYDFQIRFSKLCPCAFILEGEDNMLVSESLSFRDISPYSSLSDILAEIEPKEQE